MKFSADGKEIEMAARSVLIAAGTQPNTVLAREDPSHFRVAGKYFRLLDEEGGEVTPIKGLAKPATPAGEPAGSKSSEVPK